MIEVPSAAALNTCVYHQLPASLWNVSRSRSQWMNIVTRHNRYRHVDTTRRQWSVDIHCSDRLLGWDIGWENGNKIRCKILSDARATSSAKTAQYSRSVIRAYLPVTIWSSLRFISSPSFIQAQLVASETQTTKQDNDKGRWYRQKRKVRNRAD